MSIAQQLNRLIESGVHRIGELEIRSNISDSRFILHHYHDSAQVMQEGFGGLEIYDGPSASRDLSTYAEDGSYRFTKGQTNLKRGWVMKLADPESLRMALDQFYPASVGLYLAHLDGTLNIENLRDKLNRQTGMYRFARTITDAKAQKLVQEICGPAHQCAKRILWKIDETTALDDSEASRYDGLPAGLRENQAIPLLCQEACNHFVSECRRAAKEP